MSKSGSLQPPTIVFVGLVQPLGAIMPISEMQSRWIMSVWKGALGLPSVANMVSKINESQRDLRERYLHRARHTIQVDFPVYLETIAYYIGCVPTVRGNSSVLKELLLLPAFPPCVRSCHSVVLASLTLIASVPIARSRSEAKGCGGHAAKVLGRDSRQATRGGSVISPACFGSRLQIKKAENEGTRRAIYCAGTIRSCAFVWINVPRIRLNRPTFAFS